MKVVIVVLDPTFIPPEALMSRLQTAAESAGATAQTNMMWWIEIVQSPWITLQIKKYNITSVASSSVNFDDSSALKWETGWEEEEEEMEVKTLQMKRVGLKKKKTEKRQIKIPQMKEQRMSTKAGPILGPSQLGQQ